MAQKTQEEAVFDCFKQYPWLQDFCTYINKSEEELSWTEIYLRYAEIHWVNCLTSWDYTLYKAGMVEDMGLKGWKTIEGIPDSLLYHLIQVFDHLSGSSYDFVNRFKAWLEENYRVDSLQMKHRKGKRILNEYRLAFLEYKGDYDNIGITPEMTYMFSLANGVDAEHGFDAPIDESEMCDAIEYAEEHNLTITLVPEEQDVINKVEIGCHYHPEFKEIRDIALQAIEEECCIFDMVQFHKMLNGGFLYFAYCSDGTLLPPGDDCLILVKDGKYNWVSYHPDRGFTIKK